MQAIVDHEQALGSEDMIHISSQEREQAALLSLPETEKLMAAIHAGDADARTRFFENHLRLVYYVAHWYEPYCTPVMTFADLVQEGCLGLLIAIDRYNPRQSRFSTFAIEWIRQGISRALANQARAIRLPVYLQMQVRKLTRLVQQLELEGQDLSETRLAELMELSREQIRALLDIDRRTTVWSLNYPVAIHNGTRYTVADLLPSDNTLDEEAIEHVHRQMVARGLAQALERLTKRERMVLVLRFGLDGQKVHGLKEVGKRLGISGERVRQVEKAVLEKLHSYQDLKNLTCAATEDQEAHA